MLKEKAIQVSTYKVKRGRVEKRCSECGELIPIDAPAFTLTISEEYDHFNGNLCSDSCYLKFLSPIKIIREKIKELRRLGF